MAIVADSLPNAGASIRLVPRPEMPAGRTHQTRFGQDQRAAGAHDQDGSLHLGAPASNDETAVGKTTSQTPITIRCRADSQRDLSTTKKAADDSLEDLCGSSCVRGIKREVLTENAPSLNTAPRRSVAQWKLLLADDDAFEPIGQLIVFQSLCVLLELSLGHQLQSAFNSRVLVPWCSLLSVDFQLFLCASSLNVFTAPAPSSCPSAVVVFLVAECRLLSVDLHQIRQLLGMNLTFSRFSDQRGDLAMACGLHVG